MSLILSAEQEQFRASVRRFLEDTSPETEVRRLMDSADGYDKDVWRAMAGRLGLQGLAIPEEFGGSGFTFVELAIVLEELGRALTCVPYFSSVVLAATLLLASGDEAAKRQYLPGIADGSLLATVALAESSDRWDERGVTLAATASGAGWRLSGEKRYVLDGHIADVVFVAARTPAGVSLFGVDRGAAGLSTELMSTMDKTRKQARVRFSDTPARLVGADGEGWPVVSRTLDVAAVGLAAEQAGGAARVLEMSVDYAKVRVQFGRVIGSYQAIKHKCADMLLEVESARSAAYHGAAAVAGASAELPVVASLAKAYCSEAFTHAASENIHIHGGVGFTWEHPAHLYFKRARTSHALFGGPTYHRELLARRLGI
ncbi:acyl-CoA/acyl-ACP dehydrogenase [Amycolatopsis sp. K13G38]|uniref:Acyl-CoA/acyl-ACP dehydrogenase n=1 Tax=Amycolatopsis acididurans TaxID=2724524 RepID=A0ABX1JGV3_9PSEU|nr:acyl-CoA dehydrogenase family protein [Amycolatopsis acididurans]NKQ58059.1 acyl-CoA/acyl-ACP dehydrogenase [Amycolatopsis acididurans]